jgi:WD40 repeat protein
LSLLDAEAGTLLEQILYLKRILLTVVSIHFYINHYSSPVIEKRSLKSSPDSLISWKLQSHTKDVDSVYWDPTGEYVVSVSEDTVKVWSLNDESFVNELNQCSARRRANSRR